MDPGVDPNGDPTLADPSLDGDSPTMAAVAMEVAAPEVNQSGPDVRCALTLEVAAETDLVIHAEIEGQPFLPHPAGDARLTQMTLAEFRSQCETGPYFTTDQLAGKATNFGLVPDQEEAVLPGAQLLDGTVWHVTWFFPAAMGGFLLPSATSEITDVTFQFTDDQVVR